MIVPDGTAVVRDDVTLDQGTLRRHGSKLYVIGDVTVPETDGLPGRAGIPGGQRGCEGARGSLEAP